MRGLLCLTISWVRNSGKAGLDSLALICAASAREAGMEGSTSKVVSSSTRLVAPCFLPLSLPLSPAPTLISFCSGPSTELWLLAAWRPWGNLPFCGGSGLQKSILSPRRNRETPVVSPGTLLQPHAMNQASHLEQLRVKESSIRPHSLMEGMSKNLWPCLFLYPIFMYSTRRKFADMGFPYHR